MPEMDGITLLREAREIDPDLVGIMMTGHGTVDTAVEAMKAGAHDYILKPFKLNVIRPVLTRALTLRQLRLENAALGRSVAERTAELERANRELESYSYSIAHDLKAPLRGINGFAAALLEDYAAGWPEEAREMLARVSASAGRMGRLIDDLLRFSRLSRQPLLKELVRVDALVSEVIDELRKDAPDRNVATVVGNLPATVGDPALLRQVFVNLLANAFKFTRMRERAVIEMGCTIEDGEALFFVRDNGVGFDMQYASQLFGVFQRLHSPDEFDGTGVGLSIVERIVQRHGGRVWADAAVNRGATFFFTLPAGR